MNIGQTGLHRIASHLETLAEAMASELRMMRVVLGRIKDGDPEGVKFMEECIQNLERLNPKELP